MNKLTYPITLLGTGGLMIGISSGLKAMYCLSCLMRLVAMSAILLLKFQLSNDLDIYEEGCIMLQMRLQWFLTESYAFAGQPSPRTSKSELPGSEGITTGEF
jgi:hypothetical protein